ncbi:MAG: hypothetical protein JNK82_00090 [Myxococcaceae bacterium]|nr:hypothetical protein [Myxococcaceae bacterium]
MKTKGAVVVAALVLLMSSSTVEADPHCRPVVGTFDLIPETGACASPVGVCGKGTFKGLLRGPYVSLLTSLTPTPDTPLTSAVLITGDTDLVARLGHRTGTLHFKDSGAFNTAGEGEFAELFAITSGTGDFAGATGNLFLTGKYDFAAGGEGIYHGSVCLP